ncbi:MAG: 3-hydroxybutyrate oligomer hydrolase family protein [Wenzhouxiangellaceae bacterium]|nr:3-hydroxybutyrate oligomer hydrolase family protein [Wenzhouxiangellaceae bacterium]
MTIAFVMPPMLLGACAAAPDRAEPNPAARYSSILESSHRGDDDLLSAGLGLSGLRGPAPPLADPELSSSAQLRRLAIHSNWKGLTDLTATGGFDADARLPDVPGREFHAFVQLPGASQAIRVMLQLPDAFDPDRPCLLVAPASGSRGIYGGVPVAGPWGLPRGCAIAYTDKGAGTDLFDHASDTGVALDGRRARRGEQPLGFEPAPAPSPLVSVPHANSGDNPEADWGRHTIEAAKFGLAMLGRAFPDRAPFKPREVRVIGAAISNGGGAVLRGLEQAEPGLFDAAVVAAPNVTVAGVRHLYDYASEAALLQPCLLADADRLLQLPFGNPALLPMAQQRCQSLEAAGLIERADARSARAAMKAGGFDDEALSQAAVNASLDLWRSVAAMYASAYTRSSVDAMPCRYAIGALEDGQPQAPSQVQRRLWWATSSGVVPGAGLGWIDPAAAESPADPTLAGLQCLRALWTGDSDQAQSLRQGIRETFATAILPDRPVLVIHGRQDGLIPAAFSSRPYVQAARRNGARQLAYWEIDGAQHFDVIVPFPGISSRYRPLLPYLWEGLDRIDDVLDGRAALGGDRTIHAIDVR